jgi:hypothetical protein
MPLVTDPSPTPDRAAILHSAGERPPTHVVRRPLWQLSDSASLLVAWKATHGEDAEDVESTLISDFIDTYVSRPFAHRKIGKKVAL